jgi:solute carrier family 25 protein 42
MQTHGYIDPHRIHTAYDSNTVTMTTNSTSSSSNSSSSGIRGNASGSKTRAHHPSHHFDSRPGIAHTIKEIYLRNGIIGFFKGIMLNVIKGPITLGISFAVYDVVKGRIETFYHLK